MSFPATKDDKAEDSRAMLLAATAGHPLPDTSNMRRYSPFYLCVWQVGAHRRFDPSGIMAGGIHVRIDGQEVRAEQRLLGRGALTVIVTNQYSQALGQARALEGESPSPLRWP